MKSSRSLNETMKLNRNLHRKFEDLIRWFKKRESVLVAFSGGVDSSVVAAAATIALGNHALAVTAESALLPPWELKDAKKVAREMGVKHLMIKLNELKNPEFVKNPRDRCYHCKKELIAHLKKVARSKGIETIVEGTNADDLKERRPGALALKEEGIRSPLAELGITKEEVRKIAAFLRLPTAEKPPMACLATRIPYGQTITLECLKRITKAEGFIKRLAGVKQIRVRDHDGIARIEVGKDERRLLFDEEKMSIIDRRLRSFGFKYVTMDLAGYRSGSLNEGFEEKPSRAI